MRGRFLALTLALLTPLGFAGAARAHRLDAACQFLPRRMVRVETWFDNGEVPKTGQVEVFGGDELLVKGRLSSQGLFLFDAPEGQPLRVVIDAGQGHGKELAVRPEDLVVAQVEQPAPPSGEPAPARHEPSFPIKDVLTGVGLLIAVAAFVLSLRNARHLRQLQRSHHGNHTR
jgi:hypothetical protein